MELKKNLNLIDVFGICTGAMLSGLFVLPGLAYTLAGPAIMVSFVLAGLLAITGMLSQAELVSAMPKAGGDYFYVTRSMGPATGTVYGLITWLSLSLKSAYELVFMATYAILISHIPDIKLGPFNSVRGLAILFCGGFLALNFFGAKKAGGLQKTLVFILITSLIYFCVRACFNLNVNHFSGFNPYGIEGIISGSGFIFISFGGLLKIASVAEEVRKPGKVIPLGMILSVLTIILVYLAVIFAMIGTLGPDLQDNKTPVTATANAFLSGNWALVYSLAALLAIIASANAGIMSASRYPFALARDEMLPRVLGVINHRYNTPHISILLTGLIIVSAFFVDVYFLVKAASTVLILTYIFTSLAVVILRESGVQNYRPSFRTPLYPWVQLFGIIGLVVLLFEIGWEAILVSCGLATIGFIFYWFFGRKVTRREYALLHLIERITAQEITSHKLETELKEILHQRDEVMKDRFDHLIEVCPVLDIEKAVSMEEFFGMAAEELGRDLHIPSNEVFELLMERERDSSTVLNPFLAIPHIIIEGEHHFDVLIARGKEGIVFGEDKIVHAVFVLIGTKDERSFHLTSLAAIAQIVQDEGFEEKWLKARAKEGLRDIVLLSKRKRQQ